jgi:hypothetical protein
LLAHQKLRRFVMKYVLPRQNKTCKLALSSCKALRAPHHVGLFAMGS